MDSLLNRAWKTTIRINKIIGSGSLNLLSNRVKDPLFCFGIIAVILFGIVFFVVPSNFDTNVSIFIHSCQDREDHFVIPWIRIKESPELSLIQKNSLVAVSPPIMVTSQVLGVLFEGSEFEETRREIIEYKVMPGDTLHSLANKFDISLNTLLWANNLSKKSLIQTGQKLVILPVSGVIHHVKGNDILSQIAETYKADLNKIMFFNDLSEQSDIYVGDILIIPEGVMPALNKYASKTIPLGSSYFICPILPPCRITQGLHWYNAVDFSRGKCGDPIYAAARGRVQKVKLTSSRSRWAFDGAGNHLTILHPNGAITMYGHIQTSLVNPGDYVSQGQMIALMGGHPGTPGAGKSTGCHLHFGVRGARNPFIR